MPVTTTTQADFEKLFTKQFLKTGKICYEVVDMSVAFSSPASSKNRLGLGTEVAVKDLQKNIEAQIDALTAFHKKNPNVPIAVSINTDDHPVNHSGFINTLMNGSDKYLELRAAQTLAALREVDETKMTAAQIEAIGDISKYLKNPAENQQLKASLIDKLDSLFVEGVFVAPNSIYKNIKGTPVALEVDGKFYKASLNTGGDLTINDFQKNENYQQYIKERGARPVTIWPHHSNSLETKLYPNWLVSKINKLTGGTGEAVGGEVVDGVNIRLYKDGININHMLRDISKLPREASSGPTESLTKTANNIKVTATGKGRTITKENYSAIFTEAEGINAPALQQSILDAFAPGRPNIMQIVCGVATDYCVKNKAANLIAFVAPALEVMHRSNLAKSNPAEAAELAAKAVENIVAKRFTLGLEADAIIAPISKKDLATEFNKISKANVYVYPAKTSFNVVIAEATHKEIADAKSPMEYLQGICKATGAGFMTPTIDTFKEVVTKGIEAAKGFADRLFGSKKAENTTHVNELQTQRLVQPASRHINIQ